MPENKPPTNLDETTELAERTRAAKIQEWLDNLIVDIRELLEIPDKVFLILEQMQFTTTSFWAAIAIVFPPVFLAVVFGKGLWNLGAAIFLDKDAKLKRGARAGLAVTAITLFAVMTALPALALPLLATFISALIIKELVDLFYEYKEFVGNKAKLAELHEEQHQLTIKDPDALTAAE